MQQSLDSFSHSLLKMHPQQMFPRAPTRPVSLEGTGWRLDKQKLQTGTSRDYRVWKLPETRAHSGHMPGPQQQTTCQVCQTSLTPSPRPPAGTHVLGLLALAWPTSPASFLTTPLLPTRQPQVPEPPTPLHLLHTPNPTHTPNSQCQQCPSGSLFIWKNVHSSSLSSDIFSSVKLSL